MAYGPAVDQALTVTFGPRHHHVSDVNVTLSFADVGGRLECLSLSVDSVQPLSTTAIRRLNVGTLVERGRSQLSRQRPPAKAQLPHEQTVAIAASAIEKRGGRRPGHSPEHYARVAEFYLEALQSGRKILPYVKRKAGASTVNQAAKWIQKARQLGLLDQTTRGKPSGLSVVARASTVTAKAHVPTPTVEVSKPPRVRRKR